MDTDRNRLRATFDSAADLYQQARPEYPESLFDELTTLAGLRPGDWLLEIGCATGKATAPLARRGYRLTCIEIGPELAAAARRNLAGFPGVTVIEAPFETWRPEGSGGPGPLGSGRRGHGPGGTGFDLVLAATSWHWVDPAVKYRRSWEVLRPGGHLAFWSALHVIPADGDPIFAQLQDVYDEIGEGLPPGTPWPRPGELPDDTAEIEASGFFEDVAVRQFDWVISYTAEEYIRLLDTFSGHLAMAPWQRGRLQEEIRGRLAQRPDGRLRRHWGAALHVARRREVPDRSR